MQAKKQHLISISNKIASLITSNLESYQTLRHQLATLPITLTATADITVQLDALFHQGFIETTALANLKAISHRMDKMRTDRSTKITAVVTLLAAILGSSKSHHA